METRIATTIPVHAVRDRLAVLWTIGSGVIVLILIMQSLGNVYDQRVAEVWFSIAPMFAPALLVVIIASGTDALKPLGARGRPYLPRTFYLVAFWLSAANLFLILGTIASEPIVVYLHPDDGFAPADVLRASMLWMVPFHIIVLGVVGISVFSRTIRPGANSNKKSKSIGNLARDATKPEPTGEPPPRGHYDAPRSRTAGLSSHHAGVGFIGWSNTRKRSLGGGCDVGALHRFRSARRTGGGSDGQLGGGPGDGPDLDQGAEFHWIDA